MFKKKCPKCGRQYGERSNARGELSDIFGGATKNRVFGEFGHRTSYWKTNGALEREAFAGMQSARITNPASLETIRRYLPESYNVYQEMMKVISGGI